MPRRSVFSQYSRGVATCTRRKGPDFSISSRAWFLASSYGAMGAAMTAAPALVSSDATKAIRAMLVNLSSRLKPSSAESSWRTVSPNSMDTDRPPPCMSVTCSARAI